MRSLFRVGVHDDEIYFHVKSIEKSGLLFGFVQPVLRGFNFQMFLLVKKKKIFF